MHRNKDSKPIEVGISLAPAGPALRTTATAVLFAMAGVPVLAAVVYAAVCLLRVRRRS
ncbi:hypothetical protein [Kitasatospora cineracea]|uniref:Uncharacterized protein n=1 Tax=Kitasatospora cineracea TaxID=88074 RepID=A0A3N4R002_9ACTN|nr:hypothetical protein [Kitasatospora cineracea]RPE26598.1 hypothetical protein EDD38_7659 [Kitasatospora cineracea]